MKKKKLYRKGAAFLAAVMVFTCMPQGGLYVTAEEQDVQAELSEDTAQGTLSELQEDSPQDGQENILVPYTEADGESGDDIDAQEDPAPAPVPVTAIKLNKAEMTLQRKTTEKLTYTLEPANADTGTDVTFSSSTESVATVDANGVVTAQGVGVSTITAASANGRQDTCTVTVTSIPVDHLTISQEKLAMVEGDEKTLQVNVYPADADTLDVLVKSSDPNVADVETEAIADTPGAYAVTVTAKRGGECYILAESQDNRRITARCNIFVEYETINLTGLSARSTAPLTIYEGKSRDLAREVVFTPANAAEAQRELTWKVATGTDYVKVDARGRVTANTLPATTTADVTATVTATSAASTADNPLVATFTITVKKNSVPATRISVTPRTLALEDDGSNKSTRVTVKVTPAGTTQRTVTAASEDAAIAEVTAGGTTTGGTTAAPVTATLNTSGEATFTVTAKKPGECRLTFGVGSLSPAECIVNVKEYIWPVDNIRLSTSLLNVTEMQSEELAATIEPSGAENKNIDWTVSDSEIAVVTDADGKPVERTTAALDADGKLISAVKIKGLMVGKCTVTATASGGKKRECTVNVGPATVPAAGLTVRLDGEEIREITMKPGQTYKLTPEVAPSNADNKKVRWSSSSATVVSLGTDADYSCTVKANRPGSSTITAQASGTAADCTKTVTVNVVDPHLEVDFPENWSYTPDEQPITDAKLKESLTVWFYPIEKTDPEQDKTELADDEYELKIIGEDGRTELEDIVSEMEKPGDKILVVSHTYDGVRYTSKVSVTMEEFSRANLVSVTPLRGEDAAIWNVKNATPAAALPLPKTTEIVVKGEKTEAEARLNTEIVWNLAGSGYNPSNSQAQSFHVYGEVQLPKYVSNPGNVSLTVGAEVHVREAASTGRAAGMPKFSVAGGRPIGNHTTVELPYGSRIVISCDTEDAEIYYMLDRRPDPQRGIPKDEQHRYRNPIEVTEKTTTIYAVASMSGYLDSECSECTIKVVPGEPVEPEDPDDPDDPVPDDVTDEDREQVGGEIPEGLWAAVQMEESGKDGFAYTGKAIKPEVHVYDNTRLLTEKKDYTVAYKNNVNAGSAKGSAKPPTITVTGRGNYQGKAEVYFTIRPLSIKDDAVLMDEYMAVAYTGKEKKPSPSLSWNGKRLSKNRDYTYPDVSYEKAGVYEVEVTGVGNYKDTRKMKFEIYSGGVAVSGLTVTRVADQKYTGSVIKPPVTVKYKNTILTEGTEGGRTGNYWIKYENCKGPGNASIVIVGKGNYKGSKRINFRILPTAKISQAGITLNVSPAGTPYTGEAIMPECTVNYAGTVLKKDTDYKIQYLNNTKAGTATVMLTGMGAFTGTAKKTFRILPCNISQITAQMESSYAYEKGGCKPKPVVTYGGRVLQEGTDYTLTYRNNNKLGNSASVTVKAKGNYTGQISKGFEIIPQDISNLKVNAADVTWRQKANIYKTKVQVVDVNGKALSAGSDYSRDIVYTYADGSRKGEMVSSTDILPVGTVIQVEVRVTDPKNYKGTAYGTYRIVQADIAKAKVSVNPQQYTGKKVRPKQSQMQVVLNGVMLGKDDYEIVGYENNINQGNGKVTIRGKGSYGGTKTVTFKIGKKGLLGLIF